MSQRQDASSGGVRRKAVYVGLVLERETTARLRDSLSVADQLAGVPRG